MSTAITPEVLRSVCEQESDFRPALRAPFALTLAGERWTIATDGVRLLAVRRDDGAPEGPEPYLSSVGKFRDSALAASGVTVDTAALREFFATHASPPKGACPECHGKPGDDCESCDGDGEVDCECLDCGDTHTKQCPVCKGTGGWRCLRCSGPPKKIYVRIDATLFDAARMAPLMLALPEGTATLRRGSRAEMWSLAGDDWFAVFMPLRDDGAEGARNAPVLALTQVAA